MIEIDISVQSEAWEPLEERLQTLVNKAVSEAVKASAFGEDLVQREAEVSIVLADDDFIQDLNREYRSKDKPTNVLSFPQCDFNSGIPTENPLFFGDIILAYETIEREAVEQEKSFADHLSHLIVHGTLHLLGYDHIEDEEAEQMEALEITILRGMGIENPYKDTNFMAE